MKLSSHEEYGLRCLLQVGRQGPSGSATIPEISRKEGLSTPYVAKLMRILRQGGLVKAARGKVGGYMLALPPERILVADALMALGGRMYGDDFCGRHSGEQPSCAHSTDCSIRSLWRDLQSAIDSVLRTTTIEDLLHTGHDMTITALPTALVPLRDRAKRSPTSPIAK
jgi:Rrf2 family protein